MPFRDLSGDAGRRFGGRVTRLLAVVAGIGIVAGPAVGCASRGTILSGGPSSGQLKATISHLEYENEQLQTQVARLKRDNRVMENRLVQERLHNGELTASLDNARNVLRDQGVELGSRTVPRASNPDTDLLDDVAEPQARTLPAGQSSRKPRKPPFARIPGKGRELPPAEEDDADRDDPPPVSLLPMRPSLPPGIREPDDDLPWHPVAVAPSASANPLR